MSITTQLFPSGRSVDRCRQDAKALVKHSKTTDSPITLNAALNNIAAENGLNHTWPKALKKLGTNYMKKPKIAQTHLLGHALNLLIMRNLIDLNSLSDVNNSHLECELLGKPTVILWSYIGLGEIRLSVWWDFDKSKHPQHLEGGYKNKVLLDNLSREDRRKYDFSQKGIYSTSNTVEHYRTNQPLAKRNRYKDFVGVLCSTWVTRRNGKYLQTEDGSRVHASYVRASNKEDLCSIPDCSPNGFELYGRFHM